MTGLSLMTSLLLTFLPTLGVFLLLWLVSLAFRDATVADGWWGPGFALILLVAIGRASDAPAGAQLLVGCVLVWGARLGWYLWSRHPIGREDRRYAQMRSHHGERFARVSLGTVFILQPVIQWLLVLPVTLAVLRPAPVPAMSLLVAGLCLFCAGFLLEAMADRALAAHRANPARRGEPLMTGLFAIVRRPNYLGEIILWTGLSLMASGLGGGILSYPWPLLTPVALALLLTRVSGLPLMEPHMAAARPGYADYMARVPALIPRLTFLRGPR